MNKIFSGIKLLYVLQRKRMCVIKKIIKKYEEEKEE